MLVELVLVNVNANANPPPLVEIAQVSTIKRIMEKKTWKIFALVCERYPREKFRQPKHDKGMKGRGENLYFRKFLFLSNDIFSFQSQKSSET